MSLIFKERNVYVVICILPVFLSQKPTTATGAFLFVWRTELVKSVSEALTFDPHLFLNCMHIVFPTSTAYLFRIFSRYLNMNNYGHWLFLYIFWPCGTEIMELFRLSISLFFDFSSFLLLLLSLYVINFLSG